MDRFFEWFRDGGRFGTRDRLGDAPLTEECLDLDPTGLGHVPVQLMVEAAEPVTFTLDGQRLLQRGPGGRGEASRRCRFAGLQGNFGVKNLRHRFVQVAGCPAPDIELDGSCFDPQDRVAEAGLHERPPDLCHHTADRSGPVLGKSFRSPEQLGEFIPEDRSFFQPEHRKHHRRLGTPEHHRRAPGADEHGRAQNLQHANPPIRHVGDSRGLPRRQSVVDRDLGITPRDVGAIVQGEPTGNERIRWFHQQAVHTSTTYPVKLPRRRAILASSPLAERHRPEAGRRVPNT